MQILEFQNNRLISSMLTVYFISIFYLAPISA
jgi:hypothetical protein